MSCRGSTTTTPPTRRGPTASSRPSTWSWSTTKGEVLLICRTDNGNWAVPGGAIDLGESVAQAAVRATLEESGIECAIIGIVGIYSDLRHVILYTSNGEARQEFSIVLTARPLGGQPTPSSEWSAVRWVPESETPRLHDGPVDAHPHQRPPGTQRVPRDRLIPLTRPGTPEATAKCKVALGNLSDSARSGLK
jgi:8-oxo-dGTP pyrophosphatase MutT (NUDIX family)